MIKVTVITVVRNDVGHIEETLLSVLNQSYSNLEYIVIDGGSTDGTVEIIKKYTDRLAFWISEPDGGIYPAMNKGLEHATGEWVNFMNSGDIFADHLVIEKLFSSVNDWNCKHLIGGNTINVYSDGREEIHHAEPANVIPQRLPFSHQASFVRTADCHFDTCFKYAADYALFYQLYYQYGEESVMTLDFPIARYRQEESLTMNPQNQRKIKMEYLSIQSAHRSWQWWKEYLKLKLC